MGIAKGKEILFMTLNMTSQLSYHVVYYVSIAYDYKAIREGVNGELHPRSSDVFDVWQF